MNDLVLNITHKHQWQADPEPNPMPKIDDIGRVVFQNQSALDCVVCFSEEETFGLHGIVLAPERGFPLDVRNPKKTLCYLRDFEVGKSKPQAVPKLEAQAALMSEPDPILIGS
jgi:hypothetical protein